MPFGETVLYMEPMVPKPKETGWPPTSKDGCGDGTGNLARKSRRKRRAPHRQFGRGFPLSHDPALASGPKI